jgi:hypothetical protein
MTATDVEALPRVTLALLRWADTMCARRLEGIHADRRANRPADARFRVANRVFESARLAHVDLAVPSASAFNHHDGLEPEERQVYDAAARWYIALFGDRAVRSVDLDEWESTVEDLDVRLVGQAGLPVEDANGLRETRLLRIGARPLADDADLLESVEVRFAVLRLAEWVAGGHVRVCVVDLLNGSLVDRTLEVDPALAALRPWLADRVAVIRRRAADRSPTPGLECARCRYVAGCPSHG